MKKIIIITILGVCISTISIAQKSIQKDKSYKTWVSLDKIPFKTEGVLYEIKDLPNQDSKSVVIQKDQNNKFDLVDFDIKNIQTIQARRKNSIGKGILLGALSGFVIGGVSGLVVANGNSESGSAFTTGVPLALVGSGMGALAGSVKITIPIFGSYANFRKSENQLKELAYK